jgi:putative membrane protein
MIRMLAMTAIVAAGLLSMPAVMAQTSPAAPPGAGAPSASARNALSPKDKEFVDQAARGGLAEIDLAKLAQKSANPEVRRFADRMVTDHTEIDQRLAAIARADNVMMPSTPDIEHRKLREKLANLHDGAFDQDYARAMVTDHDQAIKLFQQERASGDNGRLKEFAGNTLPILQQHRQIAVALSHKLAQTAAN